MTEPSGWVGPLAPVVWTSGPTGPHTELSPRPFSISKASSLFYLSNFHNLGREKRCLFIRESFETSKRLHVGTLRRLEKILMEIEGTAFQVCGQHKERNKMAQKHTRHECGKLNEPIWLREKDLCGKLLKSGSNGSLD